MIPYNVKKKGRYRANEAISPQFYHAEGMILSGETEESN